MKTPFLISTVLMLCHGVQAQHYESARLWPVDDPLDGSFGDEVAVSGSWALVGDSPGGIVTFYRRGPSGWTLEQWIRGGLGGRFGQGLAIDDSIALIGAPTWDWSNTRRGKVFVYELQGKQWHLVQELQPAGLNFYDLFGRGLDVWGDVLAVGAPGVDKPFPQSGRLFVYERMESSWTLVADFSLPRSPKSKLEHHILGNRVAVHSDRIVAGAPGYIGAAYVFERTDRGWTQAAVLEDPSPTSQDYFGTSVAIYGDTIVVGEPAWESEGFGHRPGSAFVFEKEPSTGSWQLVQEIEASDGFGGSDFGDHFGTSVAVERSMIVVGANKGKNSKASDFFGKGYFFKRQRDGAWPSTETGRFKSSDADHDGLGSSIALSEGFVVAGGPRRPPRGAAFVFEVELGIRFCWTAPNSTGLPARLTVTGEAEVVHKTMTLSVRDCPADTFGAFLISSARTQLPLGDGWLCLGSDRRVLAPVAVVGRTGVAIRDLDFGDPLLADSLLKGTTVYFQFAYRDSLQSGGAGLNLSDAIALCLE